MPVFYFVAAAALGWFSRELVTEVKKWRKV